MSEVAFRAVAENCAPGVAPEILSKLVSAESGFNMFAIGVNGANRRSYAPKTAKEAAALARELIAQGHSIDMGLGQINSVNLEWLKLTPETVFDACTNLAAAETVLRDGYERARAAGASKEDALGKALSAYNTGSFTRGFDNGYVARVMDRDVRTAPIESQSINLTDQADSSARWDVFGSSGSSSALVFN
mgnify:CR=1 FL=1